MIIDIKEIPWRAAYEIVEYCTENNIESQKCFEFINQVDYPGKKFIFDIPEEHIIWLKLKGIL